MPPGPEYKQVFCRDLADGAEAVQKASRHRGNYRIPPPIWGHIRIMEKNMETTIVYGVILGQWKRIWKLL